MAWECYNLKGTCTSTFAWRFVKHLIQLKQCQFTSKSCENEIIFWSTPRLTDPQSKEKSSSILESLQYPESNIWFIRFDVDETHRFVAVGNAAGKIFIWDIDQYLPNKARCELSHARCKSTVRQVAFSHDASILISVCSDGTVWRWDRSNAESNQSWFWEKQAGSFFNLKII